MRIAYTTTFDARDIHNWSGTPFYMAKNLEKAGIDIRYVGSLQRRLPPFFKLKQIYSKYFRARRESPRFNIYAAKHYSRELSGRLAKLSVDAILSPQINPVAYLETTKPVVLWTDALYAALVDFYQPFSKHSIHTKEQGDAITKSCLSRCLYTIFSSDWAAQSAREMYDIPPEKIKVVPFGANIDQHPNFDEIKGIISKRCSEKIKLLFLAKSWERKGGDIVLTVAKALAEAGYPIELTLVGYHPNHLEPLPHYVKSLGFLSKQTPEGRKRFEELLVNTHFLFVPSRAEAYGIVFCEANAFGIPCLTTNVGGISTIIKDNINGMKFPLNAPISDYCDFIIDTMQNKSQYQTLALSAYNEYNTRLNWQAATDKVASIIRSL